MISYKPFFCLCLLSLLTPGVSVAQTKKIQITVTVQPQTDPSSVLFLAGSMNNWNPADTNYRFARAANVYELKLDLPPGRYEYKLTRGSWPTVETGEGGKALSNRALDLQTDTAIRLSVLQWQDNYKAPVRKHTISRQVLVIDTAFSIPQLARTRKIWAYLPPDYHTSRKKYPVIYMHDGRNLFDSYTSGYGEWGVDEVMDSLYIQKAPMAIIIGIDHGGSDRLTEYNPWSNERFGEGKGNEYVDFLVQTLKPFIDKKFRTLPAAKHTAVAGSSMGGLISMYAAAKYPAVFGKAGVFSPSFWIAPEIYAFVAKLNPARQKYYFVAGDLESKEMVPDMRKMSDQLLSQGLSVKRVAFKHAADGRHSEWFWHREFPDFYKWIID